MALLWDIPKEVMAVLQPVAIFGVALAVSLAIRSWVLGWLRRKPSGPPYFAQNLLDTIRVPFFLWCLVAALNIGLEFAHLTPTEARWADHAIVVFLILSFSLVASSLAASTFTIYGQHRGIAFATSGLARALVHMVVLTIGAAFILRHFNRTVAPILATLGVGGLAVALALQDTLANFFAGIHILIEAPISVGDVIRLSSGEEGTVRDIGWRTTRVATGQNNTIVIPNTKITSSILTNFSLPNDLLAAEIPILAGLDADPDAVTRVAIEEARAADGVLAEPAPVVVFDPGLTPTHMQFKLVIWAKGKAGVGLIQSDIRLRVLRRFRAESIPLPAPPPIKVAQNG
jgi:small-conductance mechanosensitive channel